MKLDAQSLKELIKESLTEFHMNTEGGDEEELQFDSNHEGFTDEPDYEGGMARNQLYTTCKDAHELIEMMKENTELPAWCQSKITLAADYITTVKNYLEGEAHLHEKKRR
jgi:hypothetical protein